ncbi:MAG: 4-alpha-glucanotransferase [Gemmatimonadales bacterium]|nr:MAG: 4-alpha-glucanotransferase [Gemmatimonadales bacterium]
MTDSGLRFRLRRLARVHGVETSYRSAGGEEVEASNDALLAVLAAMGSPVKSEADIDLALRREDARRRARRVPPVQVMRDGAALEVLLRDPPAGPGNERMACRLRLEGGETLEWSVRPGDLAVTEMDDPGGSTRTATFRILPLPSPVPHGVHRLLLDPRGPGEEQEEGWLIRAPRTVHGGSPMGRNPREWGVFLPLHALRTATDWGVGDLAGLREFRAWAAARGAHAVASLPLLATYLEAPLEPSPYSPVSRLFWNELYLDPTGAPEFPRCREARELVASPGFERHLAALRSREDVDYAEVYAVKRRVLEMLARTAFENGGDAADTLGPARTNPEVVRYARFRSGFESGGPGWWERTRGGEGGTEPDWGSLDETARYHVYVQSLVDREIGGAGAAKGGALPDLYLDLPLGCHPRGYDPWRWPELFAGGASVGAPPDVHSSAGQNWGFPPIHPHASRMQGHRYWRDSLRTLLEPSGALRVDHVMALHRLFWIPDGMPASEGVYVRYPAEELYAILALESSRAACSVVGEDLGTVPAEVPEAMTRNGLLRMYVLPFELDPEAGARPVLPEAQVSLNTHDMPTFAAFLKELDPGALETLRRRLAAEGHLPDAASVDPLELLHACLRMLADSPARLLLVNLEDLWLEERPQNVPGTGHEGGSWTRRARYALGDLDNVPEVRAALAEIRRLRPGDDP